MLSDRVTRVTPNPSLLDLDAYLERKERTRKLRAELKAARDAGKAIRHARRLQQIRERTRMATQDQWDALRAYVDDAIEKLNAEVRPTVRALIEEGKYRIASMFDLGADGEMDAYSLSYRFDVLVADGWGSIAKVHWTRLGMTMDDVLREVANLKAQQDMGIQLPEQEPPEQL